VQLERELLQKNALLAERRAAEVEAAQRARELEQVAHERERSAEALARALHFSEMFVGIVGHDLRNPLSAISTAASLLARRADSEKISRPVQRILGSTDRMLRMIDQLLDLTRIRLGQGLPLSREAVDLRHLTRAVLDELELAHQGCRLEVEAVGDLEGSWDRDRVQQLVSNVVGNACAYRLPGTPVRLRLDGARADEVTLEVHNQGVIAPDLLQLVFEPLRAGKHPGRTGLGLGLFISQQAALAHGGDITATSSEADGTRFTAVLPRRPPAAPTP
jgi:signal transduction histidine kinase